MAVMDAPTQELRVNGRPGVPLEHIDAAAAEVDFGRGVKRVAAALIYYPARLLGAAVRGLGWTVAAFKVGYQDGRHPERRASR